MRLKDLFSVFVLAFVFLFVLGFDVLETQAQGIHINAGVNIGGNRGVNNANFNHGFVGNFGYNNARIFTPFVQSYNYAIQPSAVILQPSAYVVQQPQVVVPAQAPVVQQTYVQPQQQIIQQTYAAPFIQTQVVQPLLTVVEQPAYVLAATIVATPYFSSFSPFYGVANHSYAHANFNRNFNNFRHRR